MSGTALFRLSAGGALIVHALLLVLRDGLHGGGDLTPHLRLVQLMAENPGLRSVYAPLYHGVGALLTPPDPFTQIAMAIPMVGLYELSILLSRWAVRKGSGGALSEE